MNRTHLYSLAAALVVAGIGLAAYKVAFLDFPLRPDTTVDVWDLEARVDFEPTGGPVRIDLQIPKDTRRHIVVDERFVSRGYGLTAANPLPNRTATWSKRNAKGLQTLYYRATIRLVRESEPPAGHSPPPTTPPGFEGAKLEAAKSLLAEARAESADSATLASAVLRRVTAAAPGDNTNVLLGRSPSALERMQLAADLLEHAGVPARVAHGLRLRGLERSAPLVPWLQVWDGKLWRSFDPETHEPGIPDEYFTWWRGSEPLVHGKGVRSLHVSFAVAHNKESALAGATARGRTLTPKLIDFSLLGLPLDTQAVYHVLLLVPLGALILVLLRNVVGVKTFGTFMPVLIALAFRETQLLWGVALFAVLVSLGLLVRFYLERLKLLLVPRLAAVLTVVVLLMALVSIVSHQLGIERGMSVALFPMVILTMTIERMSIVWEERGAAEAIQQGIGSLVAAALVYLVMSIPQVAHVLFIFPEMLLVLLAIMLLLGRYTGYRLTELRRFRALAQEER